MVCLCTIPERGSKQENRKAGEGKVLENGTRDSLQVEVVGSFSGGAA